MLLPGKYCQNLILKYATEELVTSILRPERYERASPVMSGEKGILKRGGPVQKPCGRNEMGPREPRPGGRGAAQPAQQDTERDGVRGGGRSSRSSRSSRSGLGFYAMCIQKAVEVFDRTVTRSDLHFSRIAPATAWEAWIGRIRAGEGGPLGVLRSPITR